MRKRFFFCFFLLCCVTAQTLFYRAINMQVMNLRRMCKCEGKKIKQLDSQTSTVEKVKSMHSSRLKGQTAPPANS